MRLLSNLEAAVTERFEFFDVHALDHCAGRPGAQPVSEALHGIRLAFNFDIDGSIAAICHEARDTEEGCLPFRGPAKSDALHSTPSRR